MLTYATKHKEQLNTSAFDREFSSGVRRQIFKKKKKKKRRRRGRKKEKKKRREKELLVYLLLYFLLLLLFSVFLHPTKTLRRKRLCLILFLVFCRIVEYISLELFYFDESMFLKEIVQKHNLPSQITLMHRDACL